jgi:hypothetical protein
MRAARQCAAATAPETAPATVHGPRKAAIENQRLKKLTCVVVREYLDGQGPSYDKKKKALLCQLL